MCVCVCGFVGVCFDTAFVVFMPELPSMQFDGSVGVATRYGMDGPGFELQPGQEIFSPPPSRPTPGAHRVSCAMGARSIFPDAGGGVKRPGRGFDHPPSPSAQVKN
jgi:hypothetical protein